MYAALALEWVGFDLDRGAGKYAIRRPVVIYYPHELDRSFVRGRLDYTHSNSAGSRGVMIHYLLPEGLYRVSHHVSWASRESYYTVSARGVLSRVDIKEPEQWFQTASEG